MNMSNLFVVIATVSILAGLFNLMISEQSMYVSDYDINDTEYLLQSQNIVDKQTQLYNKIDDILNADSWISATTSTMVFGVTGLVEIGRLFLDSIMWLPKMFSGVLNVLLPTQVADIVITTFISLIVIIMVIKLIMFVIGKEQ